MVWGGGVEGMQCCSMWARMLRCVHEQPATPPADVLGNEVSASCRLSVSERRGGRQVSGHLKLSYLA